MGLSRIDWLAQVREEALEPDLPICDTHHHLWDRRDNQAPFENYLLPEYVADFGGHRVVASVFADCNAMYRARGPEEMKAVGETEFVQGMAAMAASGLYGDCAVAAGIVAWADLRLGARVEPVLQAHIAASPNRFRGIRFATHWHPDPSVRPGRAHHATPDMLGDADIRAGLACIELFGPDRCMFESNYPIDKVSITFAVLWNAYKKVTADFSYAERAGLFCGTATRAYSLSFDI